MKQPNIIRAAKHHQKSTALSVRVKDVSMKFVFSWPRIRIDNRKVGQFAVNFFIDAIHVMPETRKGGIG